MTSPTTQRTPLFLLPHLAPGQPMYETREVLEELAERLEAVLATKAVSPPGASDLLTVAGRVSNLEADQDAEDAAYANRAAFLFSPSFEQFPTTPPYGELTRVWKDAQGVVRITGLFRPTANLAAGQKLSVGFVPVGYRPAVQLVRYLGFRGATTAAPWLGRVDVYAANAGADAGKVELYVHQAMTAADFGAFDHSWRTTNP